MQNKLIKVQEDTLLCPRCGFSYLHHGDIERWDRAEDAAASRYTLAGPIETHVKELTDGQSANPSARRGGVVIGFTCEGCGGGEPGNRIELCISQHKGETLIEWRFDPAKPKAMGD